MKKGTFQDLKISDYLDNKEMIAEYLNTVLERRK